MKVVTKILFASFIVGILIFFGLNQEAASAYSEPSTTCMSDVVCPTIMQGEVEKEQTDKVDPKDGTRECCKEIAYQSGGCEEGAPSPF